VSIRLPLPLLAAALPATTPAADQVTFDDHVLAIFQQACLNCHNPDKAKGGLDLSTFSATLKGGSGGKIVEPGDPGSKLLAVITHAAEPKMPPEGDPLDPARIELVQGWIAGGLLENKASTARKASKPKFDTALRTDPAAKPDGPPPMPAHLLLEPLVATSTATTVRALAASPWAPLLAVTGQKQVLLYDTGALRLAGVLPFPDGDPAALAFTPDGRYLLAGGGTGGKSGTTIAWEITTGRELLRAGREFDTVLAADLRPDFATVATGGPSRLLKLWDTATGAAAHSIKKHTDWITALDFSPDGVLLASGDRAGGVWVWEAATGAEFHTLRAHQARITGLAFRTDSNVLASASDDGTVRFWEMNGGAEIRKLDAHPGGVTAFGWARDGSFVTTGRDGKLKTWKPDFALLRETKLEGALPTCVAFAGDGSAALVGDWSGAVRVFRTADGAALATLPSNPPTIAARLATLHEQIRTQPQVIAGATARCTDAEGKLAAARQTPNTPPDSVRAAEQAVAAAAKALDDARAGLPLLERQRAFWQAAAVNAEAIRRRAEADSLDAGFQQLAAEFAAAAREVESRRSAVADLRGRRQQLAQALAAGPREPELAAELAAAVATLDHLLTLRSADLGLAARQLATIRAQIDSTAPARIAAASYADDLARQYQSLAAAVAQ
jgi:mono/diheme cytochrome c family protein